MKSDANGPAGGSRRDFMKNAIVSCAFAGGIGSACFAETAGKGNDRLAGAEGKYIDIHVHANAWSDTGFNLDRVSEWMDKNHVTRCVILQFAQTLPRNDDERKTLIDNFRKYQGKIYRLCVIFAKDVTGKAQAAKILSKMRQEGAIGFGEHYGEGLHVDDPKNMLLYEACAEVGLPVLFHMDNKNNMDEKRLPRLEKVLKANPKCTFIAHAGGWWKNISDGTVDRLLQKYPNIHGDLSAGSGAGAISRDKEFGRAFLTRNADKLLFGTDSGPWSMRTGPAAQFTLFESLDLPADVKAKIYGDNARALLHLA